MSAPAPTLLVLAAGMSSRYGGQSKQTDTMGPHGETLLDYSVFDAKRAGFGRVVFIIRKEGEAVFRERVVSRLEPHLPVALVYQDLADLPEGFALPEGRVKPWGTGHAVLAARHEIREPFCVINADDFYGRTSFAAMADFLRRPAATTGAEEVAGQEPHRFSMVGFQLRKTLSEYGRVARGICGTGTTDRMLRSVEEMTDIYRTPGGAENRPEGGPVRPLTGDETVSMNFWGFTPAVFDSFTRSFARFLQTRLHDPKAEFYIPLGVDDVIESGEATCEVLPTDGQWFGVTYQDDKPRVRQALRAIVEAGEYPAPLWGKA
ncbi:MAG: nucleotidyltransferase [Verrucomicrobiaceae bacterium]|nr:MAG: nucleotidyltransferase [Verrucomicrobiaceae bacterium]